LSIFTQIDRLLKILFLGGFIIPAEPAYAEVWTIDASQEEKFHAFLAKEGVERGHLSQVLEDHHAARIEWGKVEALSRSPEAPKVQEKLPTLIWENDVIAVYIPPEPRVKDHLWVVLQRLASSIVEVTEDESIALRGAVREIQETLRATFNRSTRILQSNQPAASCFPNRFLIEIIPPRPESADVFDLYDQGECMNYFLWNDTFPASLPKPSSEDIEEMAGFWKTVFQDFSPVFCKSEIDEPFDHAPTKRIRRAEKIKVLRDTIFHELERQFSIERRETNERVSPEDGYLEASKACTFCRADILENETVYESKLSWIIYNYKPISKAHFLIIPKRHVRSSESLREDELRDLHRLSKLLIEVLEETEGRSNIFLYTQDAPTIAQKVPHSHTQLTLKPSALWYSMFNINYLAEPPLSREEMRPILQKFREKIAEKEAHKRDCPACTETA